MVGIVNDYEYTMHRIKIDPDSYIIMYTDGLLEPGEEENHMKTCDDLLAYIDKHKDMLKSDPIFLLDSIVKDFGKDTGHKLKDDVALIIVRKK